MVVATSGTSLPAVAELGFVAAAPAIVAVDRIWDVLMHNVCAIEEGDHPYKNNKIFYNLIKKNSRNVNLKQM